MANKIIKRKKEKSQFKKTEANVFKAIRDVTCNEEKKDPDYKPEKYPLTNGDFVLSKNGTGARALNKIGADVLEKKEAEQTFWDDREKYKNLFNNASDAVITIDKNGYIVLANNAALKMVGYKKEDAKNFQLLKLIHPDDREATLRLFNDSFTNERSLLPNNEVRILDGNGNIKYINYSLTQIKTKGQISELEIIGRDMTENKKLTEKIKQTNDHYESVINTIRDGLVVIDKNLTISSCNRWFSERVGMPLEKISGQKCEDIIARYEDGLFKKYCLSKKCFKQYGINKVFKENKTLIYTNSQKDGSGKMRHHRISIFPTKNKTGEIYQVVMIIRDVTERREGEHKLAKLNEFNKRILDNAPVSILVLDKNGTIIALNNLASKIMGEPENKIIGKKLTDDVNIKKFEKLTQNYHALLTKGRPFYFNNMPYKYGHSDKQRYLNIVAVPLLDRFKTVNGAISMALDNTEAVLTKQKLENLNKSLEEKVRLRTSELRAANQNLKGALESKSKFMADASHEIRTPLTIIKGNLDLAIQEIKSTGGNIPEVFFLIDKEIKFIANILSDLTMLTNVDSNTENLHLVKTNLGELVEAVGTSLRAVAKEKGLILKYQAKYDRKNKGDNWPDASKWQNLEITADREKLEKLILNLMRNAIKYSKKSGYVKAWAESCPKGAKIIVEDNGIGISKRDLPHIFERFFRVNKVKSRGEGGTGLGLAICKWIIEAHNGKIEVESRLHKGSKFTVFLPAHPAKNKAAGEKNSFKKTLWFLNN